MTYPETIQYLESFINYEKIQDYPYKESIKLERVKNFLAAIDNPQDALRCLHIAGTKGKGSTCAFISYILRQAGYSVGLYTSPHLSDFRERIRILNPLPAGRISPTTEDFEGMISEGELADLVKQLRHAIEKYNRSSEYCPLSFFEVYTSLAFVYFKEKKVDFAVLETGLGGRLDATNVVNPLVAAVTPISYEHTQKLGNTLKEIATEKAGIIKAAGRQSPLDSTLGKQVRSPIVISAAQEKEAREVIRDRCKEIGRIVYEVGRDINYRGNNNEFKVKGLCSDYPNLKIKLLGKHQIINASVAIGIVDALRFYNINIGADDVRDGLYNTAWPGRCEVVSRSPLIVLDGAQNIASIRALKESIEENFEYKRLILVLGISSDKDIKGICNEIYDLADKIVLTRADNPRAMEPTALAKYFNGKKTQITDNVREAKELSWRLAEKEDLILVCGSLFVVGEFRND